MTAPTLSPDQAQAWDALAATLAAAGVDLAAQEVVPAAQGKGRVLAVLGKAGSGKTMLLAELTRALIAAGVQVVSGDYEGRRRKDARTAAVLAPTNKAAFVLRMRGVPATTIHRILYTPVYDPEYERLAEWLAGNGERPVIAGLTDEALDRALAFHQQHGSIPGALATAGLRGSDFIQGWKRREDALADERVPRHPRHALDDRAAERVHHVLIFPVRPERRFRLDESQPADDFGGRVVPLIPELPCRELKQVRNNLPNDSAPKYTKCQQGSLSSATRPSRRSL